MLALQQGQDAALARLMERWERPVKAFILRLGVAPAEVEDVAQETFVRLYHKRAAYRPGATFKPWLLTLAGNLARNRIRWQFRHPSTRYESSAAAHSPTALIEDLSPSAAKQALASERAAPIRQAIDALPAPLRAALLCVDMEELSYQEAAEVLGCTPKAIETRLYRGRQQLRERCQNLRLPSA